MSSLIFTKSQIAVIVLLIVFMLTGAGFFYAQKANSSIEIVESSNSDTQNINEFKPKKGDIVFHITGAVAKPGLYSLPPKSRVYEAIKLAGDATKDADLSKINLAKEIEDGEKIDIPSVNQQSQNQNTNPSNAAVFTGSIAQPTNHSNPVCNNSVPAKNDVTVNTVPVQAVKNQASSSFKSPSLVNINTASQSDLESLPGIGPAYAQRIIEYRNMSGGFKSLEQIMEIKGIGPKTYEKLRPYITLQ